MLQNSKAVHHVVHVDKKVSTSYVHVHVNVHLRALPTENGSARHKTVDLCLSAQI